RACITTRALQRIGTLGHGSVQRNAGKPPVEQRLFAMLAQFRGAAGGSAQAQEGDFVHPFEQRFEVAEMAEQGGGGLGADAGHAGDVVHRVAAQGEVVGDLVRVHAEFLVHAGGAPAQVAGVVPLLVVFTQQLAEVLVGGDDHTGHAVGAQVPQRAADQVVGFVLVVDHHRK